MQVRIISLASGLLVLLTAMVGQAQPKPDSYSTAAYPTLTPAVLENSIADTSSGFTIVPGTETVAINNSNFPVAVTDSRAVGVFVGGNVAPGTFCFAQ